MASLRITAGSAYSAFCGEPQNAEFERAMLRERTMAGLDAARKQGRIGGRRPKLRPHQQDEIVAMVSNGTKTAADAARLFNVHPATVSRLLANSGSKI
jgi:DNA invertase Pin-like site-specific DNA recombinase